MPARRAYRMVRHCTGKLVLNAQFALTVPDTELSG